ncbi:MAG: M48 family peptidase [Candidimonas sp.]|nr:MAG: M48 family peptidase [Candidimonas sp.]
MADPCYGFFPGQITGIGTGEIKPVRPSLCSSATSASSDAAATLGNATRVTREWVSGESFLYLGSSYRLELVAEQDEPLKLKDGRFCLLRSVVENGSNESAHLAFEAFYKKKGLPRIKKRVAHFAARVGVSAGEVQIKELGYRWASCLKSGDLHFHWKCLMAPLTVIDYIIVHELCHLHHRDHSDAFWNEVDKVLPDYRDRKDWLRVRGAKLDL